MASEIRVNVTVRMSAPMCRHVESCRHLCRHLDVPTRADIWMLFGCWDVLTCVSTSKVLTPEKVPTPLGADTSRCRHLWYQSYGLYLDTGMCWQMPAPGNVPTPRKVPTRAGMCQHIKVPAQVSTHLRADTSMCRHVLTYGCYLEAGMCWHVLLAPGKVPTRTGTCRHI